MTGQTYPGAHELLGTTEVAGVTYAYGFDAMGRPKTMTSGGGGTTWISDVVYNAASQPTSIATTNPQVNAESRAYNVMGQLTSLTSGTMRFEYDFSASANDGRITVARAYHNSALQETISYGYDPLNRLTSASQTTGTTWSATYGMDGFGNLLTVTPTGAGPSAMNVTVNPATNRVNGWSYDANGNVTAMPGGFAGSYDVENRLMVATKNATMLYSYGADNRRLHEVKRAQIFSNGDMIEQYVQYWSGQRLGRYKIRWNSEAPNNGAPSSFVFARAEAENVYFGSKPLRLGGEVNVAVDRLGSVRRSGVNNGKDYFPYGQENPSTTAGDKEKYATYKHDAATDLSYADQRYYVANAGKFMSPDPLVKSWSLYEYGYGDPINNADPDGRQAITVTAPPPPDVEVLRLAYGTVRSAFIQSLSRATDEEPVSQLAAELATETFLGQQWAIEGVRTMHPGCKDLFYSKKNAANGSFMDSLVGTVSHTRFIFTFGERGSRSLDALNIQTLGGETTLHELVEHNRSRSSANAFVLGSTVFLNEGWGNLDGRGKAQSTLHELLHVALGGDDEWDLAELLGATGGPPQGSAARNSPFEAAGASSFVNEQLRTGCSAGLRSLQR